MSNSSAAMADPPTILTLKHSFLTTQARILAQPLPGPSRAWRASNHASAGEDDEGSPARALPERAVDDALARLNQRLAQHARRAYAPQATRHVAEQLDQLYWAAGDRRRPREGEGADEAEEGWMKVGADYTNPAAIAALPPAWGDVGTDDNPLDARRYAELAGRLRALAARRAEAEARVGRLRRMRSLLAPFAEGGEGGAAGVQENLVARDGEVEKELERMRVLLARVGDKVARLRRSGAAGAEGGGAVVVDDVEADERRKVEMLLEQT